MNQEGGELGSRLPGLHELVDIFTPTGGIRLIELEMERAQPAEVLLQLTRAWFGLVDLCRRGVRGLGSGWVHVGSGRACASGQGVRSSRSSASAHRCARSFP